MPATQQKIQELDVLEAKSKQLNEEGKRIVLCHGTFDLIHTGHIRHLQEAKKQGDLLFATITADNYVSKGPGRPVFSEMLRAENLSALTCVDYVGIVHAQTAEQPISKIKPHRRKINTRIQAKFRTQPPRLGRQRRSCAQECPKLNEDVFDQTILAARRNKSRPVPRVDQHLRGGSQQRCNLIAETGTQVVTAQ